MLNELFALERGLAAAGGPFGGRHPDIKDMAKSGVIRVRLREGGTLATVELVPKGGRGALWTLRDGQQNGFPGLRLPSLDSAAKAEHDVLWNKASSADAKRTELARLLTQRRNDPAMDAWPKPAHRQRIRDRLSQLTSLKLDPLTASVPAVFTRFLNALDATEPLAVTIFDALAARLAEDEVWLDPMRGALTGAMALAIDIASDDFERDAGDLRQISEVSAALQRSETGVGALGISHGYCALTGPSERLLLSTFPQPNLPGLGQTYLFARNKDIPALTRYGRTGTASFSIDAELAGRLSGAIHALTSAERQGKTWRLIPAETGGTLDLFVASLAEDTTIALADALATEDDVAGWPAVEAAAGGVLRQLDGLVTSMSPQNEVRLLVLRTIDPANRKSLYDHRSTVGAIHEAAKRWDEAMRNTPSSIALLIGTGKGMAVRRPPVLPPLSLVSVSRRLFANGGKRRVEVIGLPANEALSLFLDEAGRAARSRRVLTMLIKRHGPLVAGLAHAKARGSEALKGFDPGRTTELRRDALRSIAWLGTLLQFLGRSKEIYMTETAFKLGQLLSAADAVHIGYCADLRGGDVPPTLLGNAVFAIAGRDPIRALNVLQGRWKPYGAWARRSGHVTGKVGKSDDQLAWDMRRGLSQARLAGQLCAELRTALQNIPVDDRFRAELLLGYVAGIERPKKPTDDNQSKDVDSEGDEA
jgi:hypothetical protein